MERVGVPPGLFLIVWSVCVCVECGGTDVEVVWLGGVELWKQDLYAQVGDLLMRKLKTPPPPSGPS